MVPPEFGINIGWFLIMAGALLLLVEVHSPGFFATVPATVMIILGILLLCGIDIFNSGIGVIVGVAVAIAAGVFTVWLYGRITPDASPTTVSRDSLVGMAGRVKKEVDPHSLSGKVMIGTTEWSARSTGKLLTPGTEVKVVDSQGVHIIVEEV